MTEVSCSRLLLIAGAVSLLSAVALAGYPSVTPTQGEPWPAPQQEVFYDTFFFTDPANLHFNTTRRSCPDLQAAIARYEAILLKMSKDRRVARHRAASSNPKIRFQSPRALLTTVEVYLDVSCDGGLVPPPDMDEQYLIKINTPDDVHGKARIIADSLWGIYRGLETFTQLIFYSDKHDSFHIRHGYIRDFPRYSYRGLLLDTSRHYLTVETLKTNIELMSFNKLNTFHWHIVDDPSFPFVSKTFPELSKNGAYRSDLVYSVEDVAEVIEFARLRGIRVVPEFDTPGHVRSWGAGVSGLLTTCYNTSTGKPDGTYGPLDPSKGGTYNFVKLLLTEVTSRFPDKYIHLGGDEVAYQYPCWLSNPGIKAWMAANNITTPQAAENVYIQKLLRLVAELPAKPDYIIWQEVVDNNITVPNNTLVHVWKGGWEEELAKVTSLGHRAILSSPWYLNRITYGIDWPPLYEVDPESFNGTVVQYRLIDGGEVCMWGEFVDDTNVTPRLWPRASAVAERLWSSSDVRVAEVAKPRMEEHRCRLLARGYQVEPANGPGFC